MSTIRRVVTSHAATGRSSVASDTRVPGMHRSATVDGLYVIAGAGVLELDNGSRTALAAGDIAIPSATMHAWRDPHAESCRVLPVNPGAATA